MKTAIAAAINVSICGSEDQSDSIQNGNMTVDPVKEV
jgi:hypothetical protein